MLASRPTAKDAPDLFTSNEQVCPLLVHLLNDQVALVATVNKDRSTVRVAAAGNNLLDLGALDDEPFACSTQLVPTTL